MTFQHALQVRSGRNDFSENAHWNAETVSGDLHDFQERAANQSRDTGSPDEAFISYQAGLNAFSTIENNHEGDQSVVGEMSKLLSFVRLVKINVVRKLFKFEGGTQQAILVIGNRQKKLVGDSFAGW